MPDPDGEMTEAQGGQDDPAGGTDDHPEMSTSVPEKVDAVWDSALQRTMHSKTPRCTPRPDR